MDLFTPIVPPTKFHPNFANCIANRNAYDEAVLSQWAEDFVDRDGKFVEEFQTTFNSSFWELYLHAVLKEVGCKIDFTHHAPDFVVTDPIPFVLEATVALNASDAQPEWAGFDLNSRPGDLNEFNRAAMLRLLNSISAKSKKYLDSYQTQSHVTGQPFVLALTPFDQPFFYLQVQRAVEAVLYGYYVDEQAYIDDPSKLASIEGTKLKTIRKNNNVELPLGIFNSTDYAHISAVLFNSSATWGKVRALSNDPYPLIYFQAVRSNPTNGDCFAFQGWKADYDETLFDGMRVYHNPHATHPLDWRVFQEPGAFQAVCENPDTLEWRCWMDRPPLAARNLLTFKGNDSEDIELLLKDSPLTFTGGWQKFEMTPEMASELAEMQEIDDDTD
jgi:hypothetical protein